MASDLDIIRPSNEIGCVKVQAWALAEMHVVAHVVKRYGAANQGKVIM